MATSPVLALTTVLVVDVDGAGKNLPMQDLYIEVFSLDVINNCSQKKKNLQGT